MTQMKMALNDIKLSKKELNKKRWLSKSPHRRNTTPHHTHIHRQPNCGDKRNYAELAQEQSDRERTSENESAFIIPFFEIHSFNWICRINGETNTHTHIFRCSLLKNVFNQDSLSSVQCDIWCIEWSLVWITLKSLPHNLGFGCREKLLFVTFATPHGTTSSLTHRPPSLPPSSSSSTLFSPTKNMHSSLYEISYTMLDALVKVSSQVQFSK